MENDANDGDDNDETIYDNDDDDHNEQDDNDDDDGGEDTNNDDDNDEVEDVDDDSNTDDDANDDDDVIQMKTMSKPKTRPIIPTTIYGFHLLPHTHGQDVTRLQGVTSADRLTDALLLARTENGAVYTSTIDNSTSIARLQTTMGAKPYGIVNNQEVRADHLTANYYMHACHTGGSQTATWQITTCMSQRQFTDCGIAL